MENTELVRQGAQIDQVAQDVHDLKVAITALVKFMHQNEDIRARLDEMERRVSKGEQRHERLVGIGIAFGALLTFLNVVASVFF